MCPHTPPCPDPSGPDREAARTIIGHPEQGWSLLCNGIVVFEDTGELLPDGDAIEPHRPTDLIPAAPIARRSAAATHSPAASRPAERPPPGRLRSPAPAARLSPRPGAPSAAVPSTRPQHFAEPGLRLSPASPSTSRSQLPDRLGHRRGVS